MRFFYAFVLFIFSFVFFTPVSYAAQLVPRPSQNCGQGWEQPQAPNLSELKENGQQAQYACCYSKYRDQVSNLKYDSDAQNEGFVSSVIRAVTGTASSLISLGNSILNIPGFPNAEELGQITVNVCNSGSEPVGDPATDTCYCKQGISPALTSIATYCESMTSPQEQASCYQCLGVPAQQIKAIQAQLGRANIGVVTDKSTTFGEGGVWTGIGCVKTNLKQFVEETVLGLGMGIAGAISLICIIFASIQMQLSRGTPEKIKKAQELMTSCIMGLIIIIFAVFLLRIIGVNILRLPGFN